MENGDLSFREELKHLDRESAHFVIKMELHHSGRNVTVVQPHDLIKDSIDLEALAHKLRGVLGTGGNVEMGRIILHGDHRDKVKDELVKMGVEVENIEMIEDRDM